MGDTPVTVFSGMKSTIFDRPIREAFIAAHRHTATRLAARHVAAVHPNRQALLTEPQLVADEIIRIAGDQRATTQRQLPARRTL
ncbi:MAG: hypothetical protein WBH51_01835 [Mycolicibacter algericus]|uniref:Uncharacterized protein n=1 Tax=Mycolicibacter longobardus TaxID=1108812 RepID=A0A1X1Y6B2_9MYCO|nr:hypothetical protein [Mycolicibacter longobardus]ORW06586.1 hypothetical protein AWC16_01220 [Mycolicibacter longobardus]